MTLIDRFKNLVRGIVLGLLVLAAVTSTTSAQPLPRDEPSFTARLSELLAKALPDHQIAVKETLTLSVTPPSGEAGPQVNLDRIWAFCSRNRDGCERAVNEYVSGVSTVLKERDRPIDVSLIRVAVRHASYLEEFRKMSGSSEANLVAEPLIGDLWTIVVVDTPRAFQFLGEGQLKKLNLSKSDAIEIGKRNVAAALRPMKNVIRELPEQGFGYITGDVYESSRLALHQEWSDIAKSMSGKLIVAIPAPDLVLYGDAGKRNAADAMASFAREAARRAQRPISVTLFEWTPTGWRPYSQ